MIELGRCSIIIGNFKSKTGMALTEAQQEWIDLKKVFDRQRPSKRPLILPTSPIRKWCYDRAVHKHGWWARTMIVFFVLHILVLMYVFFFTSCRCYSRIIRKGLKPSLQTL